MVQNTVFHASPGPLNLKSFDVHVWKVPVEDFRPFIPQFIKILSPEERSRSERIRLEQNRKRWIAARGILRDLLGRYLRVEPPRVKLSYTPRGKPFVENPDSKSRIRFNLSHSKGLALYAFAKGLEVGIDAEKIMPRDSRDAVVRRFFTPVEAAQFFSLPPSSRDLAFFSAWTRKEAFCKAKGIGVFSGFPRFDVSLVPGEPARLLKSRFDENDISSWSLHDIEAGRNFKAALAVSCPSPEIHFHEYAMSKPEYFFSLFLTSIH